MGLKEGWSFTGKLKTPRRRIGLCWGRNVLIWGGDCVPHHDFLNENISRAPTELTIREAYHAKAPSKMVSQDNQWSPAARRDFLAFPFP